jgi:hypothetical protein
LARPPLCFINLTHDRPPFALAVERVSVTECALDKDQEHFDAVFNNAALCVVPDDGSIE